MGAARSLRREQDNSRRGVTDSTVHKEEVEAEKGARRLSHFMIRLRLENVWQNYYHNFLKNATATQ